MQIQSSKKNTFIGPKVSVFSIDRPTMVAQGRAKAVSLKMAFSETNLKNWDSKVLVIISKWLSFSGK